MAKTSGDIDELFDHEINKIFLSLQRKNLSLRVIEETIKGIVKAARENLKGLVQHQSMTADTRRRGWQVKNIQPCPYVKNIETLYKPAINLELFSD